MSATKVRLLQAASEAAGGTGPLSDRLGISEAMLRKYISGVFPLPDPLLLRAVDFILQDRDADVFTAARALPPASDQRDEA
jgi:hypothetical protein